MGPLQRLAERLDDANHCEGSEVTSNLTEESGVASAANCEARVVITKPGRAAIPAD